MIFLIAYLYLLPRQYLTYFIKKQRRIFNFKNTSLSRFSWRKKKKRVPSSGVGVRQEVVRSEEAPEAAQD